MTDTVTPDADAAQPQRRPPTVRSAAKARRRESLLKAAAELFAQRGFNGVSIEDLGAAVGVSGPAVYRHFRGKQAVLAALLIGVSEDLSQGGAAVVEQASDDESALRALVRFHVDFATAKPDVIRVQDQDLGNLTTADRRAVRVLQRSYVELWVQVLGRLRPEIDTASLRIAAHATFGLINSTPFSARIHGREPVQPALSSESVREILERMALAALMAPREDTRD
ncbi:MAG: TetR/AcrR family transcriptional regulator [Microbacteriaceae bacterium]